MWYDLPLCSVTFETELAIPTTSFFTCDIHVVRLQFRYFVANEGKSACEKLAQELKWTPIGKDEAEAQKRFQQSNLISPFEQVASHGITPANGDFTSASLLPAVVPIPQMRGGGITRALTAECEKRGIDMLAVVAFCSEAANDADGLAMAALMNVYLAKLCGKFNFIVFMFVHLIIGFYGKWHV